MIFIPVKFVPYLLIILGIGGAILVGQSEAPDKVGGVVVCLLAGIGGIVWATINILRSRRSKK